MFPQEDGVHIRIQPQAEGETEQRINNESSKWANLIVATIHLEIVAGAISLEYPSICMIWTGAASHGGKWGLEFYQRKTLMPGMDIKFSQEKSHQPLLTGKG
jgi:hypothetical protein